MTQLPQPRLGSPWFVHDFRQVYVKSQAAAGGLATTQLEQVPERELWIVQRAVVQCTSATKTEARLYLDSIDASRILDGTRAGNFDVADEASGIQIPGGSILLCQWSGAADGAIGTMRAQLMILRRRDT